MICLGGNYEHVLRLAPLFSPLSETKPTQWDFSVGKPGRRRKVNSVQRPLRDWQQLTRNWRMSGEGWGDLSVTVIHSDKDALMDLRRQTTKATEIPSFLTTKD